MNTDLFKAITIAKKCNINSPILNELIGKEGDIPVGFAKITDKTVGNDTYKIVDEIVAFTDGDDYYIVTAKVKHKAGENENTIDIYKNDEHYAQTEVNKDLVTEIINGNCNPVLFVVDWLCDIGLKRFRIHIENESITDSNQSYMVCKENDYDVSFDYEWWNTKDSIIDGEHKYIFHDHHTHHIIKTARNNGNSYLLTHHSHKCKIRKNGKAIKEFTVAKLEDIPSIEDMIKM